MTRDDEYAVYWNAASTQMPVTVSDGGAVVITPGFLGWVDNIRAYEDGVTFDSYLLASIDHARWAGVPTPSFTGGMRFDEDPDPPLVEVFVVTEGRRVSSSDGTLHLVGGESSPGSAAASWWLPEIPSGGISVGFALATGGLSGRIELAADAWRQRSSSVRKL